jgi:hypothetical protein
MTINTVEVINGSAGNIGPPGPEGGSYDGSSTTPYVISVGPKTIVYSPSNLAYQTGTRIRFSSAAQPTDDWMEGVITSTVPANNAMLVTIDVLSATRDANSHNDWMLSVAGQKGDTGNPGAQGVAGRPGNVIWHGVNAPTGTVPASPVDGDYYLQTNPATPGSPAYLWGPYAHAATPPWGSAGLLLAVGPAGPAGATGATGATGAAGPAGPQGIAGPSGSQGPPGNQGIQGTPGPAYGGQSLSSQAVVLGSVTLTLTGSGYAYAAGARVRAASQSSGEWMEGIVTAYSGSTLTFTSDLVNGSASHADWNINIAGVQGQVGPAGPAGAGSGDMLRSANLSDLTSIPTARNNLGLAAVAVSGSYADLTGKPVPPTQRLATASPISLAAGDEIINCNISSGSPSCSLPSAATRAGRALVFKDTGGQFGAHPLTLNCAGAEKMDGLASITLNTNYQFLRLVPANDGTSTGWSLQ